MFAPTQKPRVIAAAVVIVSPLCAGRAIGELGTTALTFLPIVEVRIEIEHLDAF